MNATQKIAVWLGVVAIIASSLYPPWSEPRYTLDTDAKSKIVTHIREMEQSGKAEEEIRGYVAEARRTYGHPQSFRWLFDSSVNGGKLSHVDLPRLLIEWLIALAISVGLYFAWPFTWLRMSGTPMRSARKSAGLLLGLIGALVVVIGGVNAAWPTVVEHWGKKDWVFFSIGAIVLFWILWDIFRSDKGKNAK